MSLSFIHVTPNLFQMSTLVHNLHLTERSWKLKELMIFKFISNSSSLFLKLVNLPLTFTTFKFFPFKILLRILHLQYKYAIQFFLSLRSFAKTLSFLEKKSMTIWKTARNLSKQFPFDNHRTSVCSIKLSKSSSLSLQNPLNKRFCKACLFYFVHSFNNHVQWGVLANAQFFGNKVLLMYYTMNCKYLRI